MLNYLYNPLVSSPFRSRVYTLWQMVQDSRNCVPKERNEKNVGEEGLLCAPQGPRGGIFFFPISSFSTTLSRNRYIYICIPVSKAADRKSKTKVSFFSLGGRSWDTFLFPPLSTPFFRRHRLLLSLPFPIPTISYHSCHPQPFSMFDVLPLALPPSSLSLSLSPPLHFSIGFCLKELVLAHFARNPFFL